MADLLQVRAQIASLKAQSDQKKTEQDRLRATIAAETDLIATLQQRVTMKSTLIDHNAGSKADLIDAMETLQDVAAVA